MIGVKDLRLSPLALRQPVESRSAFSRPYRPSVVACSGRPIQLSLRACPDRLDHCLRSLSGKMMMSGWGVRCTQYQLPHQRKTNSHASVLCSAALDSKCSTGQTQTANRQSTNTTISIIGPGMQKTPKLEKGGEGGPPRDGGGGGGGGGGGSSSGGFFLFSFLLFLRYLRDLEREEGSEGKKKSETGTDSDMEQEYTPVVAMEDDDW